MTRIALKPKWHPGAKPVGAVEVAHLGGDWKHIEKASWWKR